MTADRKLRAVLPKRQFQSGFTIVELLIVTIAILILICMLLPAVQQVRETARRIACANNLLNIGSAIGQYELAFTHLPPGVVNDKGPIFNDELGKDIGFLVQLLPFLERSMIYDQFDFVAGSYAPQNSALVQTKLPFLACSTTIRCDICYAGCHHHLEAPIDVDNMGLLFLNSQIRGREILDGRSHTILLGEKVESYNQNWASGTGETLRNTSDLGYKLTFAPTSNVSVGGFSSVHPNGGNFCLADGSIQLLSYSIDRVLFGQLGHRADGNMISPW